MIQRLYVHNYRCLENFELRLEGRPSTLLIGRNGVGKSTVRLALAVLRSVATGTNRVGQLVGPADFNRGRVDVPMRFEVEVVLDGALYHYNLAFELPEGFRELRVREEKLSRDGIDVYSRELSQVKLLGAKTEFGIDWHMVALPIIQERSPKDPLRIFKDWLAGILLLNPAPSQMSGESQGDTLRPDLGVESVGAWIAGLLTHAPRAYQDIESYLRQLMPDFAEIRNRPIGTDARSLEVRFQKDEASLTLPFGSLSDGEKCFFVGALVVAANQVNGPLFCFWDEPDSHLALSEVGHFIMAQRRTFQTGGQFLATSHHEEAIRHFSRENTFVLGRHSHLEPTLVRLASELQVEGDFVDALIRDDVELGA
jgi:predicted ATPase